MDRQYARVYETEGEFAAYRAGLKRAIYMLAVNRDGQMLVGTMEKPIAEVMAEVDKGEWD